LFDAAVAQRPSLLLQLRFADYTGRTQPKLANVPPEAYTYSAAHPACQQRVVRL